MGCFSYICKITGKAVLSNSFTGDAVHLFLLEKGEVIEHMFGNYDSYGRVFDSKGKGSHEWEKPWSEVCDLMFSNNKGDGIAAILDGHYNNVYPTTRSKNDPNQGWGKDMELLNDVSSLIGKPCDCSYHVVMKKGGKGCKMKK